MNNFYLDSLYDLQKNINLLVSQLLVKKDISTCKELMQDLNIKNTNDIYDISKKIQNYIDIIVKYDIVNCKMVRFIKNCYKVMYGNCLQFENKEITKRRENLKKEKSLLTLQLEKFFNRA